MTNLTEHMTVGRMHVLRHAFEPNPPLAELMETMTGSSERSRFLLRSTKEVYVDSATYVRGGFREEDELVQATVEAAKRKVFVIARAAMRPLVAHEGPQRLPYGGMIRGYRLALLPARGSSFQEVVDTLDAYPHTPPPHKTPSSDYLYLDVPVAQANSRQFEEAQQTFQQEIATGLDKHLYAVRMLGLRSIEAPRFNVS